MPFRTNEPTIPNALPIRTENGDLIGAIARATGGIPGTWEPYILDHAGDGYDLVEHGGSPITEADASVRAQHALLVRLGSR